jgi:hypothetical protein
MVHESEIGVGVANGRARDDNQVFKLENMLESRLERSDCAFVRRVQPVEEVQGAVLRVAADLVRDFTACTKGKEAIELHGMQCISQSE